MGRSVALTRSLMKSLFHSQDAWRGKKKDRPEACLFRVSGRSVIGSFRDCG